MNLNYFPLILVLAAVEVSAGNATLDAAIGGTAGAAIGNELGGRNSAIVGGALGATIGTTVTTDQGSRYVAPQINPRDEYSYPRDGNPGYHCPPGQEKKGRC